jgi:hypothetical protein
MSAMLKDNRRRDMAIECKRCGGPTMLETVIKLRRGVLRFRETRWQGGYWGTYKLSVPTESHAAMRPSIAISGRHLTLSRFWPMWLRIAPARSSRMGVVRYPRPMPVDTAPTTVGLRQASLALPGTEETCPNCRGPRHVYHLYAGQPGVEVVGGKRVTCPVCAGADTVRTPLRSTTDSAG